MSMRMLILGTCLESEMSSLYNFKSRVSIQNQTKSVEPLVFIFKYNKISRTSRHYPGFSTWIRRHLSAGSRNSISEDYLNQGLARGGLPYYRITSVSV